MMAAPMTQAVGGAPPPRSAVRGDSTTVSPRGRGSYIWTGPIHNLGAKRKLTSETALVRALTLPVGAAPSPRSTVCGASITVSVWGQGSYKPSCGSPALGAMVNGRLTPTPTLMELLTIRLSPQAGKSLVIPPQGGGDSHMARYVVLQSSEPAPSAQDGNRAIHADTPSPLRGEGWGGGGRLPVAGEGWGLAATCSLAGLVECLAVPSEGEHQPAHHLTEDHQKSDLHHPHLNHSTKAWAPALMGK